MVVDFVDGKAIPVVGAVSTAKDVYDAVQWLRSHEVDVRYLSERQ
ncbi:hypothetical protein ACIGN6_02440 [Streptomyces sp. NPDC053792]